MATPIPDNVAAFTVSEIVSAAGGWASRPAAGSVRGVATDTRVDLAGKLFVALVGESFDGHDFLTQAAERGAAALCVSREPARDPGVPVVVVKDTLDALGQIARLHRRRWGGTLVAIGGSAGKTTTRGAVTAALDAVMPGQVHYARGNLNNRVGVPMVLLGVEAGHRVAVVEVGTNERGEVGKLSGVCEPDIALLTLIGMEHAAGIGDIDEIEAEEGDLLAALGARATAIGNGDDDRVVRQLARSAAATKLAYGTRGSCTYRLAKRTSRGLSGATVEIERPGGRVAIETDLIGEPGALAVTAALAVADRVVQRPLDAAELVGAFSAARAGEPGRLVPLELADGTVVLDDTYNANPASVTSSIATAREIAQGRGARLVLVLGEMRELGPTSAREHDAIGRALAESDAAAIVGVTGDARRFGGAFAEDAEAAIALVLDRVRPGDVVLVKASRGVHAEKIVEALVRARGRAA